MRITPWFLFIESSTWLALLLSELFLRPFLQIHLLFYSWPALTHPTQVVCLRIQVTCYLVETHSIRIWKLTLLSVRLVKVYRRYLTKGVVGGWRCRCIQVDVTVYTDGSGQLAQFPTLARFGFEKRSALVYKATSLSWVITRHTAGVRLVSWLRLANAKIR